MACLVTVTAGGQASDYSCLTGGSRQLSARPPLLNQASALHQAATAYPPGGLSQQCHQTVWQRPFAPGVPHQRPISVHIPAGSNQPCPYQAAMSRSNILNGNHQNWHQGGASMHGPGGSYQPSQFQAVAGVSVTNHQSRNQVASIHAPGSDPR